MRFKEVRQNNNASLMGLCKELKISRFTLMRFEEGYIPPAINIVKKLSSYFGVTSDYLLGLENNGQEVEERVTLEEFEKRINKDKEYLKKFVSCIKTRLLCEDM